MKKAVFDYIKEHPHTDLHQIARSLKMEELKTLSIINKLQKECYITLDPILPLSETVSDSCRYRAIKREYLEK